MEKDDLRNGMVVVTREGKSYLVLEDKLLGIDRYLDLAGYNNNLFWLIGPKEFAIQHDIMEVYAPSRIATKMSEILVTNHLGILWERKAPIEMSISEIEKQLGLDPGTLRIKKDEN